MDLKDNEKKKLRPCPCCGNNTLECPPGHYEICPVCFWEDDQLQSDDPDYAGGANTVCLREARENYKEFGVCEKICCNIKTD